MYPVLLISKKAGKMSANLQSLSVDVTSKISYLKGVGMLTSLLVLATYSHIILFLIVVCQNDHLIPARKNRENPSSGLLSEALINKYTWQGNLEIKQWVCLVDGPVCS